jgi:hypothetical protein
MARFVLRDSILKKILIASCMLGFACVQTPVALAQHVGGRTAGAGHFGSGTRVAPPHVLAPPTSRATIWRPRASAGLPSAGAGTRTFRFPQRPIYVFRHHVFFGPSFDRYGFGLGFNSLWWPTCGPFWDWGFNCYGLPFYGYGYGSYFPAQAYEYPVYQYSGVGRELPQLYLKDGTVYNVIDYWIVDGQIHFTMLDESGTKSVEHVIDLDELDLQQTIGVATQRGFRFMLRNEPMEQYLQHHPNHTPPVAPPPKGEPS